MNSVTKGRCRATRTTSTQCDVVVQYYVVPDHTAIVHDQTSRAVTQIQPRADAGRGRELDSEHKPQDVLRNDPETSKPR